MLEMIIVPFYTVNQEHQQNDACCSNPCRIRGIDGSFGETPNPFTSLRISAGRNCQ